MTGRKLGGWVCVLVGGAISVYLLAGSAGDEDWGWLTDLSKLPKYALAGPLPLLGGIMVLRDEHGSHGDAGGKSEK